MPVTAPGVNPISLATAPAAVGPSRAMNASARWSTALTPRCVPTASWKATTRP
ncbi:hypothetical protein SAMN05216266_101573 [Amycolatopsis marina]|uniref:Uncharacterized protein n=1 Tax=Amycolatopsis marina TaxID=490629 RepID=A0A1I0VXN0_9PSEU|nr:hypothetical protein SAMN05216266_101573 [Amycolatopsis marina]